LTTRKPELNSNRNIWTCHDVLMLPLRELNTVATGTHLCRRSKTHLRPAPSRRTNFRRPSLQDSRPSRRCRTHSIPPCWPSGSTTRCNARCAPWRTSSSHLQRGDDRYLRFTDEKCRNSAL